MQLNAKSNVFWQQTNTILVATLKFVLRESSSAQENILKNSAEKLIVVVTSLPESFFNQKKKQARI